MRVRWIAERSTTMVVRLRQPFLRRVPKLGEALMRVRWIAERSTTMVVRHRQPMFSVLKVPPHFPQANDGMWRVGCAYNRAR